MNKRKWTDEQFITAVKSSFSYAEVLRKLNLKVAGSNYDTVKRKIKELNLDISHMTRKIWNKGKKFEFKPKIELKDALVVNSSYISSNKLKYRLLKEGLKQHICENCHNSMWCKNKIPLELHHINGDKHDNRIENLQLLCPNCHAITDNYRGRNIGMSA